MGQTNNAPGMLKTGWYRPNHYAELAQAGGVARNPKGPDFPFDPDEPSEKRAVKVKLSAQIRICT